MYYLCTPLVIFQVLISLKDDGADLSSVNCVVPLLLLLGFFLLWALIFVCFYRTPYEEYQAARAQQDIGRHVVWKV
jgi:predicted permease